MTLVLLISFLFDLSLARGLDYYTGVIFEAVLTEDNQLGSIAGGGRYDNLVGMFSPQDTKIPAVGFSIGIERVFSIMEEKEKKQTSVRSSPTDVLVATIGTEMLSDRLKICSLLWQNKIKAEYMHVCDAKLKKQLEYANNCNIPYVVIMGPDEKSKNIVKIKSLFGQKEEKEVKYEQMIPHLKSLLQ